jgi:GNAT superfamily N-acetyltransferase
MSGAAPVTSGPAADPVAVAVEAAGPGHAAALGALFTAAGSPCFCRFWHFSGDNNAWLDRCYNQPGVNRAELEAALAAGSDEARGVVALGAGDDEAREVVGWLKVAPAAVMTKAYSRRLYRKLPCFEGDRAGVFLVGCALVHPAHRHRGVATALVAGAVRLAPAWGARALEALPRRPKEPVSDDEMWTGPMGVYERNGFVEVYAFEPYPVLRRELP